MGEPAVSPVLLLAHDQSMQAGAEWGGRGEWLDGLETEMAGLDGELGVEHGRDGCGYKGDRERIDGCRGAQGGFEKWTAVCGFGWCAVGQPPASFTPIIFHPPHLNPYAFCFLPHTIVFLSHPMCKM